MIRGCRLWVLSIALSLFLYTQNLHHCSFPICHKGPTKQRPALATPRAQVFDSGKEQSVCYNSKRLFFFVSEGSQLEKFNLWKGRPRTNMGEHFVCVMQCLLIAFISTSTVNNSCNDERVSTPPPNHRCRRPNSIAILNLKWPTTKEEHHAACRADADESFLGSGASPDGYE